ncbi:UDP-N-acetylglucosamine transporter TMEM241 isoform X5 [Castor canadensis]|uniref:UDP-N-acetylglucosamine transporter TMEM241 isoform X5 n=2 Tax=Castor canadensis TaxID=51338 RepID=A0AC58MA27_CASCN
MSATRSLVGLTFCACYPAFYLVNKVADVCWWTFASCVMETGLGRDQQQFQAVPVFIILHNIAEVIICGYQKCFRKEKTSPAKICSALFLLAAAGCLPFNDSQFDPDGYFWAVIHLFCVGVYKILQKSQKPSMLSDIDQQYLNYIFSVALLAFASHPTGDLFSVLDFPFLYFYRFHGSCCASGFLGFFLMFSTVKMKSLLAPGQCAAWIFLAKPPAWRYWRGLAGFLRAEGLLMKMGKERRCTGCQLENRAQCPGLGLPVESVRRTQRQ